MIQFLFFLLLFRNAGAVLSGLLKQVLTTIPGNNQRPSECDSSSHGSLWPQLWPSPRVRIWASRTGALELLGTKAPTTFTSHLGLEEHEALARHRGAVPSPGPERAAQKGTKGRNEWPAAPVLSGGEFEMLMCLPSF